MADWAVTTANDKLQFDTQANKYNSCYAIDSNHFINFWSGNADDGYVQVFTVNTTTWAVTTAGAQKEFDVTNGTYNSCYQIDANHFINFWLGASGNTYSQVFTVSTSTWAVTTANAALTVSGSSGGYFSCFQVNANHFISFWCGADNDGFAQVFTVNTTTWAVTTANNPLEFDTANSNYNSCYAIDSNHFINFWTDASLDGKVQVFTVNTTTWAVTTAGASLEFDTQDSKWNSCYAIDSNHFINFWAGPGGDGFVQVFTVNTSTWTVTTAAASLEFDTTNGTGDSCYQIDANHFINFWSAEYDVSGYVQVFTVELPAAPVASAAPVFMHHYKLLSQ